MHNMVQDIGLDIAHRSINSICSICQKQRYVVAYVCVSGGKEMAPVYDHSPAQHIIEIGALPLT